LSALVRDQALAPRTAELLERGDQLAALQEITQVSVLDPYFYR
jgi:hypothetical protein